MLLSLNLINFRSRFKRFEYNHTTLNDTQNNYEKNLSSFEKNRPESLLSRDPLKINDNEYFVINNREINETFMIFDQRKVEILVSSFHNCTNLYASGGAIILKKKTQEFILKSSYFIYCSSLNGCGGAIIISSIHSTSISETLFKFCFTPFSGQAIFLDYSSDEGLCNINQSIFTGSYHNNCLSMDEIHLNTDESKIYNVNISRNTIYGKGSIIFCKSHHSNIKFSSFENNFGSLGGNLQVLYGLFNLHHLNFIMNSFDNNSLLSFSNSRITFKSCVFFQNLTDNFIEKISSTITFENGVFVSNFSQKDDILIKDCRINDYEAATLSLALYSPIKYQDIDYYENETISNNLCHADFNTKAEQVSDDVKYTKMMSIILSILLPIIFVYLYLWINHLLQIQLTTYSLIA